MSFCARGEYGHSTIVIISSGFATDRGGRIEDRVVG